MPEESADIKNAMQATLSAPEHTSVDAEIGQAIHEASVNVNPKLFIYDAPIAIYDLDFNSEYTRDVDLNNWAPWHARGKRQKL